MKWYRIQAMLLKYMYLSITTPDRIFDVVYWPVVGLLLFGFTTKFIKDAGNLPSIVIFLLGGIMLWTIFQRMQQDISFYILEDFWSRNLSNLFVTPIRESEIFMSVVLLGLVRAILSLVIMIAIAYPLYAFNIFGGGILSLVFVIPLFMFAWGMGIFVAGMIFRFGLKVQVLIWSISFLFQPIATMTYPLETLPLFLQKVALATPLYYAFEGFRQAYNGNFIISYFVIGTVLALAYMTVGYYSFIRSVRRARKTGLITYY